MAEPLTFDDLIPSNGATALTFDDLIPQKEKPSESSIIGSAWKGLAHGAPEAVGDIMQGAAALAPAAPTPNGFNGLVGELRNVGSMSDAERAALKVRAIRLAGNGGLGSLAAPYNAAIERIAAGGDPEKEIAGITGDATDRAKSGLAKSSMRELYDAGSGVKRWINNAVPASPEERSSIPYQVGSGVSGVAPYVAAGAAGGPLAGLTLGAVGMGLQTAGSTFEQAKEKGASDEDAASAAGWGAGIGAALGVLPLGMVFKPVQQASPGMKAWLAGKLVQAGQSGFTFATVGEAQDYLLQQVAKGFYDPQAGYSPEATRIISSFLTGGILGAAHPLQKKAEAQKEQTPADGVELPPEKNPGTLPPDGGSGPMGSATVRDEPSGKSPQGAPPAPLTFDELVPPRPEGKAGELRDILEHPITLDEVNQRLKEREYLKKQIDTGANVPETDKTLAAQQSDLIDGYRPAQMFPVGTSELPLPSGMDRVETSRGVFHFNQDLITRDKIIDLSRQGRENEILGLGQFSKSDIAARPSETPVAVVERSPDGTEVKSAAGTVETAPAQIQAIANESRPGDVVNIERAEDIISDRLHGNEDNLTGRAGSAEQAEPVAHLTGSELGEPTSMAHLRILAAKYMLDKLVGKKVLNRETGFEIAINRKAKSKVLSGARGQDLMRLVPAIPEMLERGRYIGSEADRKERHNVVAIHRFMADVDLAGRNVRAVLTVREMQNGKFFYDLSKDRDARIIGAEERTVDPSAQHSGPTLDHRASLDDNIGEPSTFGKKADESIQVGRPSDDRARVPKGWDYAENGIPKYRPGIGEQERQVSPNVTGHWKPTEVYTANESKIAEAVNGVLAKMFPGARGVAFANLHHAKLRGDVHGVFVQYPDLPPLIGWSLQNPKAVETARHEGIHFLRRTGVLTEGEWATLSDAAERGNWIDKHNIDARYRGADRSLQIEEAVAEEFGKWRSERYKGLPDPVRNVFHKIDLTLRRIAAAVREVLGKKATANDLFTRIETGEIGARKVRGYGPFKMAPDGALLQRGFKAYHGSPHDFDKFDSSKIGSGEGAQAYGHGLYFAGNEEVARSYRDALAPKGKNAAANVYDLVYNYKQDPSELARKFTELSMKATDPVMAKKYAESASILKDGSYKNYKPEGHLYEANINADPEHFLDWDKPLSEQPHLKEKFVAALPDDPIFNAWKTNGTIDNASVGALYSGAAGQTHADLASGKTAAFTQSLRDAGIQGIKYRDQGSRMANIQILNPKETVSGEWIVKQIPNGEVFYRGNSEADAHSAYDAAPKPTYNYVVFDDSLVEITHKNGKPVPKAERQEALAQMRHENGFNDDGAGKKPPSVIPVTEKTTDRSSKESKPVEGLFGGDKKQTELFHLGDVPEDERSVSGITDYLGRKVSSLLDPMKPLADAVTMNLSPMAMGSKEAQATAKDFANGLRYAQWKWANAQKFLEKNFKPDQLKRMWEAADEESVLRQKGESVEGRGLSRLTPEERGVVEELQRHAQSVWQQARNLGMVEGEGLPSYTPRMLVKTAAGGAERVEGKGDYVAGSSGMGGNLRTSTPQMKGRKHLTTEETEAAGRAKFGDGTEVVKDIRTLALATSKLQEAVAGKQLIKSIEDAGKMAGSETVSDGIPAHSDHKWFTIDHPAFQRLVPKLVENKETGKWEAVKKNGELVFEKKPIYVRSDFEGPLKSVLTVRPGAIYKALMDLKGRTMSVIMYIHNAVEWGRALPAMPGKVATFRVYFEGNKAKHDQATMREAILHGLVPIGERAFNQDITSVINEHNIAPGRSFTSKVLAAIPGLFDPRAGDAVRRAVDKMGDFWHNTLLWDRIGDLQAGLYVNFRDHLMAKGASRSTAATLAAHWANRYAGALPMEAMSDVSRKAANLILFSRSFTLGNLGAMKDMLNGMPRDLRAQIEREAGPAEMKLAQSLARRKAIAIIAMDLGLMYAMNSLLQSASNVIREETSPSDELKGYADRFYEAMHRVKEHPLSILNPLGILEHVSATSRNEPGKQDRVLVGYTKDGQAIYARNPAGKIGEEFLGYLTGPLDMLKRKLGTLARPAWQVLSNDTGFGRKVYDPYAETPEQWIKNAGRIAMTFMSSQVPTGAISAANDLAHGEGDPTLNKLQLFGPLAGVTFSRGAPGGPAMGEIYRSEERYRYNINAALPDIRKMIQRGDIDGATSKMTQIGVPPKLQSYYIRTTVNPQSRMSKRKVDDFLSRATDEEIERFQRARKQ